MILANTVIVWRGGCVSACVGAYGCGMFSAYIFTAISLKNNCLNVWYVVFSLYLCNTESDTKKASGGRSSQISTEAKVNLIFTTKLI